MSLKNFFTGKSGVRLWVNIGLMLLVLVAVPLATFYMLNTCLIHFMTQIIQDSVILQ